MDKEAQALVPEENADDVLLRGVLPHHAEEGGQELLAPEVDGQLPEEVSCELGTHDVEVGLRRLRTFMDIEKWLEAKGNWPRMVSGADRLFQKKPTHSTNRLGRWGASS